MWVPIGLGNGPLVSGGGLFIRTGPAHRAPVAITFLIGNSGRDRPVIDAVELIGWTSYAAPRVLGLNVATDAPVPECRTSTPGCARLCLAWLRES